MRTNLRCRPWKGETEIKVKNEPSVTEAIRNRRSVRQFRKEPVSGEVVDQILESGLWAPSGKNNQPWKFAVIRDEPLKEALAGLTHYRSVIKNGPVCIAVFLDQAQSYDRTKDVQAIGASIQNMLLTLHALGLGGVWLGEILKNREKAEELLGAGRELELMAVIALGHRNERKGDPGEREPLEKMVFLRR